MQFPDLEGKNIMDKSYIIFLQNKPVIGFQGALVSDNQDTSLKFFRVPCDFFEDKELLTKNLKKYFSMSLMLY